MRRLAFVSLLGLGSLPACGGSGDDNPFSSTAAGGSGDAGTGGSVTVGSGTAGKAAAGSGTAGSGTAGSGTAGSATAGSGTAGSGTAGSETAGSGTAGSGTAGSGTAGKGAAGKGTAGSGTAGKGTAGTNTAGSGTAGSGMAGSGTAGSGTAGTNVAGSGTAGSGNPTCTPGTVEACYEGPPGSDAVAPCQGGTRTCDAGGFWGPCDGQVLPVPDACDGFDQSCDGVWTVNVPSVCPTIQAALDAASATGVVGTVDVSPGTYPETLHWKGANVHVVGAGPGVTTVDAKGQGSVALFDGGETSLARLANMTLKGGSGTPGAMPDVVEGGCIEVSNSAPELFDLELVGCKVETAKYGYGGGIALRKSAAVVRRVRILSPVSNYYGGGIYLGQADGAVLSEIEVRGGKASYGAGIASYFSNVTATRILVAGGAATSGGGGLFVQGESPSFANLTVHGNSSAYEGGGIYGTSNATFSLVDAVLSSNKAMAGGGLFVETGLPTVTYSDFFANSGGDVGGIPPLVGSGGNVSKDPKYVSLSGGPLVWDLHLGAGSPLVDAGDPTLSDPDGSAADMGAYGGP